MSDLELLPEDDALAGLEDRLLKVVEQIPALRKERDEAVAERDAARKSSLAALEEAQRLRAEVDELRSKRKQVKARLEKLIERVDQAASA